MSRVDQLKLNNACTNTHLIQRFALYFQDYNGIHRFNIYFIFILYLALSILLLSIFPSVSLQKKNPINAVGGQLTPVDDVFNGVCDSIVWASGVTPLVFQCP